MSDDFDLDSVDFDAIEKKNDQKIEEMNKEAEQLDEGDGCEGGACKI